MSDKIIFPNEILLSRASQTVAQGKVAIIPVKGQSMFPFIHGDEDCVELYAPTQLKVGDIVLARFSSHSFLLHRILFFEGKQGVVLMGDGNIKGVERCSREDIVAKALIRITPDGKRKRLNSPFTQLMAKLWKFCLPFRRYLLSFLWKLHYLKIWRR